MEATTNLTKNQTISLKSEKWPLPPKHQIQHDYSLTKNPLCNLKPGFNVSLDLTLATRCILGILLDTMTKMPYPFWDMILLEYG